MSAKKGAAMAKAAHSVLTEQAFKEFQQKMIEHAKAVQGDNYAGDDYYLQRDCWYERFEDGDSPEDTVDSDMEAWDQ